MGLMTATDERLLHLSQAGVARATKAGWPDRPSLMRDLAALKVLLAAGWVLSAIMNGGVEVSLLTGLMPTILVFLGSLRVIHYQRRIGLESDHRGWKAAASSAAQLRATGAGSRYIYILFSLIFVSGAVSVTVACLLAPSLPFPLVTVFIAAYFVAGTALVYVEASDPPPPSTSTSYVDDRALKTVGS
jgi:hypothetical protein